jgi:hypothetical protein
VITVVDRRKAAQRLLEERENAARNLLQERRRLAADQTRAFTLNGRMRLVELHTAAVGATMPNKANSEFMRAVLMSLPENVATLLRLEYEESLTADQRERANQLLKQFGDDAVRPIPAEWIRRELRMNIQDYLPGADHSLYTDGDSKLALNHSQPPARQEDRCLW